MNHFIIDSLKSETFAFPQGLISLDISNNQIDSEHFDDILYALNGQVSKHFRASFYDFGFILSLCSISYLRLFSNITLLILLFYFILFYFILFYLLFSFFIFFSMLCLLLNLSQLFYIFHTVSN